MATNPSQAPAVFDPKTEEWQTYMCRFRMYLEANNYQDLPDNRKRALFLTYCGPRVFKMAQTLVAPANIESVTWAELQSTLRDHYAPAATPMVSRNEFYRRSQKEGETINEFVANLREIAGKCEFINPEEMMKDRIILGMRDLNVQKKLLVKKGATFKDALEAARAAESSETSAADIRRSSGIHLTQHEAREVSDGSETDEDGERGDSLHRVYHDRRTSPKGWERETPRCAGCMAFHSRADCRFRDTICRRCQRKGHIAEACRASQPTPAMQKQRGEPYRPGKSRDRRRDERFPDRKSINQTTVGHSDACGGSKFHTTVNIEGEDCNMELDTGSFFTIVSWSTLRRLNPGYEQKRLKPQAIRLNDFQGNTIKVLGRAEVKVQYKGFRGSLALTVVEKDRPSLLGIEWFAPLNLDIVGLNQISGDEHEDIFREFADVFDGKLGNYKGKPISFNLDPGVAPIRLKYRRVPFALRPKVDEQLDKLIAQGILEPVDHATWETPIVTPMKPDGSLRLCADYKCTLNRALQQSAYPVPVVQHLLHSLGKGKIFAKLDLAQAYQQLPVDAATAEAQTIVTHRGAFRCTRLQFGVSVAPGLFQSIMERLLHGIPGVVPYFDDVLISGETREQLLARVKETLRRFQEKGLKLKRGKCEIGVPRVEFLGYLIDGRGIHPTDSKVKAIREAPRPKTKAELQAFLGLLNFYGIFLKQKATIAEPLHRLLSKAQAWTWGQREDEAFQAVKQLLSSDSVLIQYTETLPLLLTCDASPYGIGAVLSHRFPNGQEAPIAFYSKTLSSAERNYSQLDKEALAIVAGVKRFHEYVYGRPFEIITDHKPLLGLLAGDKQTPTFTAPRMTRWIIFLAGYNYKLIHRPGLSIGNADGLSRCPTPEPVEDPALETAVLLIDIDPGSPTTSKVVAEHTRKDTVLAKVVAWVLRGWPQGTLGEQFRGFEKKKMELAELKGCLLWGERVVIPESLRGRVMETLHEGHPGIARMKALARSYIWWPQIDKDITDWVSTCLPCQESRPAPPRTTPMEWEPPRGPWSRIHIDFAGPMGGQMFLIIVDAYSKWLEVVLMPSTTTGETIRALRKIFSTHGLPDVLVSDNGPQLTAREMEVYLARLGIRHVLVAPHCPAGNGMAERMVRVTKETLTRMGPGNWQERIDKFLLAQHITPSSVTQRSPAELLMGRKLRSRLDRLHPEYIIDSNQKPPQAERGFSVGDLVFAHNYAEGPTWVKATVTAVTGPKSYRVELTNGTIWRRHIDQLRARSEESRLRNHGGRESAEPADTNCEEAEDQPRRINEGEVGENVQDGIQGLPIMGGLPFEAEPRGEPTIQAGEGNQRGEQARDQANPQTVTEGSEPRRSTRVTRPPAYLKDYVLRVDEVQSKGGGVLRANARFKCVKAPGIGRTFQRENWRDVNG